MQLKGEEKQYGTGYFPDVLKPTLTPYADALIFPENNWKSCRSGALVAFLIFCL